MTAEIGRLWEEGEALKDNGDFHQALLRYQQAKTLLIAESKRMYDPGKPNQTPKVLGDIMEKLTNSIDSSITVLGKNPILVLGLSRGYTQADVKKNYRKLALKYHPDKNTDCDSSCLFTLIQAAYERILPNAPLASVEKLPSVRKDEGVGPQHRGRNDHTGTTSSHPSSSANNPPNARPQGAPSFHSKFFSSRSDSQESAVGSKPVPPSSTSAKQNRPSTSSKTNAAAPPQATATNASNISFMSTEDLREAIRVFGFTGVDKMSREQLLKKMLAIKAYLDKQKETTSGGQGNEDRAGEGRRNTSTKAETRDTSKGMPPKRDFAKEWEDEIRKDLGGRGRDDVRREREAQQRWDENRSKEQDAAAKAAAAQAEEEKAERKKRQERDAYADCQRRMRQDVLAKELPVMSIAELKRMMAANNISAEGCVEKQDLLDRLHKYLGVKPIYPHPDPAADRSSNYNFNNPKSAPVVTGDGPFGAAACEEPTRPMFSEGNKEKKSTALPSILKESEKIRDRNKTRINVIMKDDELKFVIGNLGVKADRNMPSNAPEDRPKTPAGQTNPVDNTNNTTHISAEEIMKKNLQSSIWTTEKLKNLEQKVMKRGIRPRDTSGSKPAQPDTTVAEGREQEPPHASVAEPGGIYAEIPSPEKDTTFVDEAYVKESDIGRVSSVNTSNFSPIEKRLDHSDNKHSPSTPKESLKPIGRTARQRGSKVSPQENVSPGNASSIASRSGNRNIEEKDRKRLDEQLSETQSELNRMKMYEEELKRKIKMDQEELKKKLESDEDINSYVFDHGFDRSGHRVDSHALREELRMNKRTPTYKSKEDATYKNTPSPGENNVGPLKDAFNSHNISIDEPHVVFQHPGFHDASDDDLDVESVINPSGANKKDVGIVRMMPLHGERGILEEQVERARQRASRKTLPDKMSEEKTRNNARSHKLPTEFSDDFVDVPLANFMPPVRSVFHGNNDDNDMKGGHIGMFSGIKVKASCDFSDISSPIDAKTGRHGTSTAKHSSTATHPENTLDTSIDYNISFPSRGMGLLESDDEDVDDIEFLHDHRYQQQQYHKNDEDSRGHNSENQASDSGPAIFHKTIRVQDVDDDLNKIGDGTTVAKAANNVKTSTVIFNNRLDSFDDHRI